jgi:hypothetical protein
MQPRIQLLSSDLVQRILGEAFQLMMSASRSSCRAELLQAAGADVQPTAPVYALKPARGPGNGTEEFSVV